MQNRNRQHSESGYLMLNGPDDTLWIPRSSNKSWLTLFYLLPKELVQKQKEYLSLLRRTYEAEQKELEEEVLRLEKN